MTDRQTDVLPEYDPIADPLMWLVTGVAAFWWFCVSIYTQSYLWSILALIPVIAVMMWVQRKQRELRELEDSLPRW